MEASDDSHRLRVGVLYNVAEPACTRADERISEEATALAARQAADALTAWGWEVCLAPVRRSLGALLARLRRDRPDVLVNLCEAFAGRSAMEANVAGLLELLAIPFTGSGPDALRLCQNKLQAKSVLNACGLPTPRGWAARCAADVPGEARYPLIVKPVAEDASIGIGPESVVRQAAELQERIARIVGRYDQPALVEEFLDGREFNVTVVDHPRPRALPVSEIRFDDLPEGMPRIVDYAAKWRPGHPAFAAAMPECPARVPELTAAALQDMALRACAALGLRGYARVDFRMDTQGRPHILEVNPNPDTSRDAGLARALDAAGIPYARFWKTQVELALRGSGAGRAGSNRKGRTPMRNRGSGTALSLAAQWQQCRAS